MAPEAPEPGAVRAKCGECSAWHPMHAETCSKFVPERHSGAQNLFWLESAKTFAAVLAGRSSGTFPLPTLTVGTYAAAIADELLEEAVKRGRL